MDTLPIWLQSVIVIALLTGAAFFSTSETSIMAVRHKVNQLALKGRSGRYLKSLIEQTENTLSLILIGNNILNTLTTVLVTSLALKMFGSNDMVLSITTAIISCVIILLCEILPKVLGASFAQKIALSIALPLYIMLWLCKPLIWVVNKIIHALFVVLNINIQNSEQVTLEDIKTMMLETRYLNNNQRSILNNFFKLSEITVNEVMTPKSKIEAINLNDSLDLIISQIASSYHNKLLVFDVQFNKVVGILHVRKIIHLLRKNDLNKQTLKEVLVEPYYIPENVHVSKQLEYFQKHQERMGLVVNEYGEIKGLVTLEDILEELIGKFTTSIPQNQLLIKQKDGSYLLDASISLRDVEKYFNVNIDHKASTLNGLLLDYLGFIPDNPISFKLCGLMFEIIQTDDYGIKIVKIMALNK